MSCYDHKRLSREVEAELREQFSGEVLEQELSRAKEALKYGYAGYTVMNGTVHFEKLGGQKFHQEIEDLRIHKDFHKAVLQTKSGKYKVDLQSGDYYYMNGGDKVGTIPQMEKFVDSVELAKRENTAVGAIMSESVSFNAELGDKPNSTKDEQMVVLSAEMINDPDKMLEMFDVIREQDGIRLDDEYADSIRNVLRTFVDPIKKLIPDMAVYIETNAEKNYGEMVKQGADKGVHVGVSNALATASNQMSATEKYVHEIMHAALVYAEHDNRQEVVDAMIQIEKIHEQMLGILTWEMLLPENSIDAVAEERIAKARLEYITSGKAPISEFMAMALTNKELMRELKKVKYYDKELKKSRDSIWEKLIGAIMDVYETLTRFAKRQDKNIDNFTLMFRLLQEVSKKNNKVANELAESNATLGQVSELWDTANDKVSTLIKDGLSAVGKKVKVKSYTDEELKDKNVLQKMGIVAKNMAHILGEGEIHRHTLHSVLSEATHGKFKPEGMAAYLMDVYRDSDDLQTKLEFIGLENVKMDRLRKEIITASGKLVLDGYEQPLTHDEQVALTKGLIDTDVDSLFDVYSIDEVERMFNDEGWRHRERDRLRQELSNYAEADRSNYWASQAIGLGRYMVTGQGGKTQLLNATNIAKYKVGTSLTLASKDMDVIVSLIDKLSTLEGIGYLPQEIKDSISALMEKDKNGVHNTIANAYMARHYGREEGVGEAIGDVKGYFRETSAMHLDMTVAPTVNGKAVQGMVDKRYQLIGETEVEGFGYYVNSDNTKRQYTSKGIRLTSDRRSTIKLSETVGKGTEKTIVQTEKEYRRLKADTIRKASTEVKEQSKGIVAPELDGLIPILKLDYGDVKVGKDGKVKRRSKPEVVVADYEIAIEKNKKEAAIESDRRVALLIGHMTAHGVDVQQTAELNETVLDTVYADMAENYREGRPSRNGAKYVLIGPDEGNKYSQEIWPILPPKVKQEIIGRAKISDRPENIAVRQDQVLQYFGNREPSILDLQIMNKKLDEWMPKIMTHVVAMAEMIWKELTSVVKVDIVIRTPMVLVGNIASNIAYSIMAGSNPLKVLKQHMEGVKELQRYLKHEREKTTIELRLNSGNGLVNDERRLKQLDAYMRSNSVKPLMDAGLYQAIADDVEIEDLDQETYLRKQMNKVLDKAPKGTDKLVDWLFITERTELYKAGVLAIQMSDFASRYHRYQVLKDKMSTEKAVKSVLDEFINYNLVDPVVLQWLNKVGLVMFTKFVKGVQLVLKRITMDKPLNVLTAMIGDNTVYDVDDITDQMLPNKNWGAIFPSAGKMVDHLVTPTAYEGAEAIMKRVF